MSSNNVFDYFLQSKCVFWKMYENIQISAQLYFMENDHLGFDNDNYQDTRNETTKHKADLRSKSKF